MIGLALIYISLITTKRYFSLLFIFHYEFLTHILSSFIFCGLYYIIMFVNNLFIIDTNPLSDLFDTD